MASSEPITYDAYVEYAVDGFYTAQLLDLLGCYARGATEAEALQRLDDAIPAYYDWLRSHDDDTPIVKGPFSVRRAELVAAKADGAPGKGVFFENDALPMEDDDLDWTLAILTWAYDDFLALLQRIPRERLAQPMTSEQHKGITPMSALEHALALQAACLSYVSEPPTQPPTPPEAIAHDVVARVGWARDAILTRLREATDDVRTLVHEVDGERWSLRKIARTSIMIARITTDVITYGATE
jgi:predicted RNase H-like HicB family nuclease